MSHPALEPVIRALQHSGAAWCVLDDESAAASAVDLLVDGAAAPRVRAVLAAQRFMALPAARDAFVSYHRPTDQWVEVRLYTELSYGPYAELRTRAEAACLARRQCDAGLCRLHADDRFWACLLESLLGRRAWEAHDLARLQALLPAARLDGPLARTLDAVCPPGWTAERTLDEVRQGTWQELARFAPVLAAAWLRHPQFGAPLRRLTRRLSGALHAALREQRSGLAVALLGPDGSGKSTLSARVATEYYFPTRSVYMGLWQRNGKAEKEAAIPGWSLAGRLLKIWRHYAAGRYHRWRGRLVIFDRYTYDALLPSGGKRTPLARLYAWTLGHACPSPDLILLLDAPGEVMYARKHESSPEQLEAQRQGFLALQDRVPQLQVIDATCPQDAVRADVVDRIWSRALARG